MDLAVAHNAGQLGLGHHANRATPVRVHLPKGVSHTGIGAGWNAEAGWPSDLGDQD